MNVTGDAIERDLASLMAFLERERANLLDEARRRRAAASEEQRLWAERPVVGPKEMERRLEEGVDALIDLMDEESAAATARLMEAFASAGMTFGPDPERHRGGESR